MDLMVDVVLKVIKEEQDQEQDLQVLQEMETLMVDIIVLECLYLLQGVK